MIMSKERIQFNNVENYENYENIRSIEVPKEEIESLNSIKNFLDQVSEKEFADFNGPIGYAIGTNKKINELFQLKRTEVEKDETLSKEEKEDRGFYAKREAEYEACKDVIEYKKEQLNKLLEFIENQKIWKTKFSTASNVVYSRYTDNPLEDFRKNLEKSEEMHKKFSFAGQNLNSIYFISNSGISLRIKPSSLFGNGNIREAVEHACEVSFCIDDILDEDHKNKSNEFPLKFISFEPKIGCRVEEFFTEEFIDHAEGNFKSKIQIINDENNILVKNSDGYHSGHYINKIYF